MLTVYIYMLLSAFFLYSYLDKNIHDLKETKHEEGHKISQIYSMFGLIDSQCNYHIVSLSPSLMFK